MNTSKISDVRPGTKLKCDGGFTCMSEGTVKTVREHAGALYVPCNSGRHYLDGQINEDGGLIGLQIVGGAS